MLNVVASQRYGDFHEVETRTSNGVARVHRRGGSISPIRRRYDANSFCSTRYACAPRARIQEESVAESESARPQAKDQAFGLRPRFPRRGLVDESRFSHLTSEFLVGESLSTDFGNHHIESFCVVGLPVIESANLFVDVPEQVKRLHADISSVQSTLEQLQKFSIPLVWTFPFTYSTA